MPPIDTQKQRLYDAERAAFGGEWADVRLSRQAQRCLVHDAHNGDRTYPSVQSTQAYVDAIRTSAQFQRRWGFQSLTVIANWGGTSRGGFGRLHMAPAHRVNEAFILHEIAHNLVDFNRFSPHGPEFAATVHELVKLFMGKDAAADLRAAYAKHRVKYIGTGIVPSPSEARYAHARSIKIKPAVPGAPVAAEKLAARKASAAVPMTYEQSYDSGFRTNAASEPSDAIQRRPGFDYDAWTDGWLDSSAGRARFHLRDCEEHHNGEGGCGQA